MIACDKELAKGLVCAFKTIWCLSLCHLQDLLVQDGCCSAACAAGWKSIDDNPAVSNACFQHHRYTHTSESRKISTHTHTHPQTHAHTHVHAQQLLKESMLTMVPCVLLWCML